MGNKSTESYSSSSPEMNKSLYLYQPICDSFDQNLGKLKIYRKKVFSYDYIAVSNKLVQRYLIEDLKTMATQCNFYNKVHHNNKNTQQHKILLNAELWLKIYSCELSQTSNKNENLIPVQICSQFLTYTLKEYITNNPSTLLSRNEDKTDKSLLPTYLAYILACVLDAYNDLRNLHETHPCPTVFSAITSLTTPNLIYISIEGQLKFLTIPLFIYSDNLSKLDQCLARCCHSSQLNEKDRNATTPKYGTTPTSVISGTQGIDKLDKQFLNKFKKMAKIIRIQTDAALKNKEKQESFLATTTHVEENKNNNLQGPFMQTCQKLVDVRKLLNSKDCPKQQQQSYWDLIENANNISDLLRLVQSTKQFPSSLELPALTGAFLQTSKKKQHPNKHHSTQDQIKFQKIGKVFGPLNTITAHQNSPNNQTNRQYHPTQNYQLSLNNKTISNLQAPLFEQPKNINFSDPSSLLMRTPQPQNVQYLNPAASNSKDKNSIKTLTRKTIKKNAEQGNYPQQLPNFHF